MPAGPLQIAGTACAVHRGVSAVEVRVDGGEWVRAAARRRAVAGHVAQVGRRRGTIDAGEHTIEARTTDGLGQVQTDEVADVAPNGATGYDVVPFAAD